MDELPDRWADAGRVVLLVNMDQFAKPGILPSDSKRLHASKRARQSRATFAATSTRVLVAAAYPGARSGFANRSMLADIIFPEVAITLHRTLAPSPRSAESGLTFRSAVSKSLFVPTA
jgi:hypothetical protein